SLSTAGDGAVVHAQSFGHSPELPARFLEFLFRLRAGHQPSACIDYRSSALDHSRSYRNDQVRITQAHVDESHDSRIPAPLEPLVSADPADCFLLGFASDSRIRPKRERSIPRVSVEELRLHRSVEMLYRRQLPQNGSVGDFDARADG